MAVVGREELVGGAHPKKIKPGACRLLLVACGLELQPKLQLDQDLRLRLEAAGPPGNLVGAFCSIKTLLTPTKLDQFYLISGRKLKVNHPTCDQRSVGDFSPTD